MRWPMHSCILCQRQGLPRAVIISEPVNFILPILLQVFDASLSNLVVDWLTCEKEVCNCRAESMSFVDWVLFEREGE